MNMGLQISLWDNYVISFPYIFRSEYISRSGINGHITVLFEISRETSKRYSMGVAPICLPTNSALRPPFSTHPQSHLFLTSWWKPFKQESSGVCCPFDLHFLDSDVEYLVIYFLGILYVLWGGGISTPLKNSMHFVYCIQIYKTQLPSHT